MDILDIQHWASDRIETITISQIYLDAPYDVEVREFEPVHGDMLVEQWMAYGRVKSHPVPRYALANMYKTAEMLGRFINQSVGTYIVGTVGNSSQLIWDTYYFAFKYIQEAKTDLEKDLIRATFRFWVACRKTSNPHHIFGSDKLGGQVVDDPTSMFFNVVPMPVIMIAQMECIMYTKVLRPRHKEVLQKLTLLVNENKRENWLTIYLTMFILLHNCSLISKRDWETARQYNDTRAYANPTSIEKHHTGVNVMLAHFHYLNKGRLPFLHCRNEAGLKELATQTKLGQMEIQFITTTSYFIWGENHEVSSLNAVRKRVIEQKDYSGLNDELYWVSQLYEEKWTPGPTAFEADRSWAEHRFEGAGKEKAIWAPLDCLFGIS